MGSSKRSRKRKRVVTVETEDEMFEVECILKARVTENALKKPQDEQWEYYVKWAGYDSDANTWEPSKNLARCQRLVESFWQEVGWDNEDYTEGVELVPSKKWIMAETNRFWQGLTPRERESYAVKENDRRAMESGTLETQAIVAAGTVPDTSSAESTPEPTKRSKQKNKKPRVNREGSEHDDIPLSKKESSRSRTIPAKRKELPSSSDEEPLNRRRRKPKKITKITPQPEAIEPHSPSTKHMTDKGKQKAIEETRPDSPSSLFSVDSAEEVTVVTLRQPESHPVPERESSKILLSTSKDSNSKASPSIPSSIPKSVASNSYLQSPDPSLGPARLPGISTKQRLSLGANVPINPKEAMEKQSQSMRSKATSNLAQLKFNKKSSTNALPVSNESALESPTINPPELTLNALNAPANKEQSPINMFMDSFQTDSPIAIEPPQLHNSFEADEFLSSMAGSLPGFGSPLEPPPDSVFEPKPPPGLSSQLKVSNMPKIQKKWKWEGQLSILRANDEEELVGSVVCTNVTVPKLKGMRIPLTFDPMNRLTFISFHDSSDALIFLKACKTADQFATLSARDTESLLKFKMVADYLAKHQQVVLVPVWYEKNVVGHLLFFPVACEDLVRLLEVPSEIITHAKDGLIVSLHGWNLKPAHQQEESRFPLSDIIPASTRLSPCFEKGRAQDGNAGPSFDYMTSMRTNVDLHFALRVLNFPPDLFDWLTVNHRIYAVYHEQERRDDKSEPIELGMLKAVMKGCQAQEWKYNESKKEFRLRIVFVHVGSVSTFTRSPLTQKRNILDIRFYSYGTDGNTPRSMWGIREIYPIGGVVTFYPSAFIEDYAGTIHLIRNIHEHPLWIAFISPSCLGYLACMACSGQDPLVLYGSEGQAFIYFKLLNLITDGEIALITVPPESTVSIERMKSWAYNYCRTMDPLDALSIGTAAFHSVCANDPPAVWASAVQKSTNVDILAIQRHPAILYQYRRFMVVKGPKDQTVPPNSVELVTPHQFAFQDDYFKRRS